MKLIIDIPEDALKEMKTKEFISIESLDTAIECIKNGTPLDDVKAEIDEQYDRVRPYNIDVAQSLEMALDILNNISKESEDKPNE